MAEQVIVTLSAKRREIEAYIGKLERDLEQARRDLSAIHASIVVFSGEGPLPKSYMNLSGVFPRHEIPKLCKTALEAGPLSTRDDLPLKFHPAAFRVSGSCMPGWAG
jgi:hypothetical protein